MSNEASGYVERHSPYRGATFSIHRSVGEIANDANGNEVWMTLRNLAAKSRVSLGAAKSAVDQLVADGFLMVVEPPTYRLPGKYRFVFKEDAPVVFETRESHEPTRPEAKKDRSVAERCSSISPGTVQNTVQNTVQSGEHIKPTEVEPNLNQATPPVSPPPSLKLVEDSGPEPLDFADFWIAYPHRNGRKVGTAKCKSLWADMTPADQHAAVVGARNYALEHPDGAYAKDPERFLAPRHRLWEDFLEAPGPRSTGPPKTEHRVYRDDDDWAEARKMPGVWETGGQQA